MSRVLSVLAYGWSRLPVWRLVNHAGARPRDNQMQTSNPFWISPACENINLTFSVEAS